MGNRAVITTPDKRVGIYLHWNGGRDSVEAFLRYCEIKGYLAPSEDCYGWARLCQVIGNFFGGTTCVGIDAYSWLECDNGDNGTYIIDGWKIVDREYFDGVEQNLYDLTEALKYIDERMPAEDQIGKQFWEGKRLPVTELIVGDEVFVPDGNGHFEVYEIVGIGEDRRVNGTNVAGIPYVNKYGSEPENNINNYLREKEYVIK